MTKSNYKKAIEEIDAAIKQRDEMIRKLNENKSKAEEKAAKAKEAADKVTEQINDPDDTESLKQYKDKFADYRYYTDLAKSYDDQVSSIGSEPIITGEQYSEKLKTIRDYYGESEASYMKKIGKMIDEIIELTWQEAELKKEANDAIYKMQVKMLKDPKLANVASYARRARADKVSKKADDLMTLCVDLQSHPEVASITSIKWHK